MRPLAAFASAFLLAAALVAWRNPPELPMWTIGVGALGAGFLASIVVGLRESLLEDAAKAVIFTVIGGVLLFQGLPAWMVFPVVVGPWVGLVFNRRPATLPADGPSN